ncbi:MAG: DUF1439 domain-containing protein [Planctomycetota bacterium]
MRNLAIGTVVVLLVAVGVAIFAFKGERFVVRITNEQIQERLDQRFPFEKTYFLIFGLGYKKPLVELIDGTDRVRLGLEASVELRGAGEKKRLTGRVDLDAGIAFHAETGEFFLVDSVLHTVEINGIPAEFVDKVPELLRKAAAEVLERHPIYTLRARDLKTATAKLLLQGLAIEDGVLIVTLGI